MNPSSIKEGLQEQLNTPYYVDLLKLQSAEIVVKNITSLFLGIVAYLIAIFMTLVTVMDVIYLTMPGFREKVHEIKWDGSRAKVLRAVSIDAINSFEYSISDGNGRSALSIYAKKRMKSYIIAVIILFIVIGGMGQLKNGAFIVIESIFKVIGGTN